MNLDIKDLLKESLSQLAPHRSAQGFRDIGTRLEGILRKANASLARVSVRAIEDRTAGSYFPSGRVSRDEYEDILNRMLTTILNAEDYRDGLFCRSTSPNWAHIQSAYVLLMLQQLKVPTGSWIVGDDTRSVEAVLRGLISGQHRDGSWGEDFYDTCFTLSAVLEYKNVYGSMNDFGSCTTKASEYITGEIQNALASQHEKEWFGAGFFGSALYLLGKHEGQLRQCTPRITAPLLQSMITDLLTAARTYYIEDGDVGHFVSDDRSQPTTPDEWHTAEMLLGLSYCRDKVDANTHAQITALIQRCLKWLDIQRKGRTLWCNNMGSRLSFIITGRVLHALAMVDDVAAGQAIGRLAPVLHQHMSASTSSDALICDLPVTINLMLGISAKASIGKKVNFDPLLATVLSQQIHEVLESIGSVKQHADAQAHTSRRNMIIFIVSVVLCIILLAIPAVLGVVKALK